MVLKLYNTRTRAKENFQPLDPTNIRMYVCGPTVYDFAHIGNARPVIVFDVLYRLLRHLASRGEWDGGKGETNVTYVRNITDVDDKINARAAEQYPNVPLNEAIRKVTEDTAAQFHADVAALGCLEPTVEPRATEHIDDMKRMIETLVAKGCAYVAEDHVLFSVSAMPDYGQLSRRSLDEMEAGARVEVAPYKRDPMDFVLWKPSEAGEPGWPSPCSIDGLGRPGWHIECSAMAEKHLGKTFDIHGGGIDLVFPHHENELAQSRCAHDAKIMANVWMHNGFLQVEGQKMSKSLGNFVTIHELYEGWQDHRWPGEIVRFAMLMTHYREPIDWTVLRLHDAWKELEDWVRQLPNVLGQEEFESIKKKKHFLPHPEVVDALSDDLNTPKVIAVIRALNKKTKNRDVESAKSLAESLVWLGIYRPELHFAYLNSVTGYNPDIAPMLAKYEHLLKDARAVVLNEHSDRIDYNEIRDRVNKFDPRMTADGVSINITRNGYVYLDGAPKQKVTELIEARSAARKAKDWGKADRIRDELAAMGIALKDAKDPETGEIVTTWEIAR